jgi:serine phosphatase RsbU (regulator of sigma subunit)
MGEHGWLGPIEWAAARRPRPGEPVCGDQPIAIDVNGSAAVFGVLDGLGHGAAAATAALRAVDVVRHDPAEPLDVLIKLCHRALTGTRGAAMTLARIGFENRTLSWIGIGNVAATLVANGPTGVVVKSSALLTGGIVGYRIPDAFLSQDVSIAPGDLLVIATDGIAEDYLDSVEFAGSATVIAMQILRRHSKQTDDALVLVARHRGSSS